MSAPASPPTPTPRAVAEIVLATLAVFTVFKVARPLVPGPAWLVDALPWAFLLYVPLQAVDRAGVTYASLGLRLDRWKRDAAWLVALIAVVTPAYAFAFRWWVPWAETFSFQLPDDFVSKLALATLPLAFIEELFFRGFLQERWTRLDPTGWWGGGVAWRPLVFASGVFALIHFVGEWNPARLAPFFPSLLFGLLRAKTGTIVAATLFHAYCNALADVLFYGFS